MEHYIQFADIGPAPLRAVPRPNSLRQFSNHIHLLSLPPSLTSPFLRPETPFSIAREGCFQSIPSRPLPSAPIGQPSPITPCRPDHSCGGAGSGPGTARGRACRGRLRLTAAPRKLCTVPHCIPPSRRCNIARATAAAIAAAAAAAAVWGPPVVRTAADRQAVGELGAAPPSGRLVKIVTELASRVLTPLPITRLREVMERPSRECYSTRTVDLATLYSL